MSDIAASADGGPSAPVIRGDTLSKQDQEWAACEGLTERERMVKGLPYLAMVDEDLLNGRLRVRPLMQKYNNYPWPSPPAPYFGPDERQALLGEIFGLSLEQIKKAPIEIEPPFYVDYGTNIHFEGSFYANMDLIILDAASVKLGARVLCGPRVGLYAASHSTDVDERQGGYERAYPIEIGDDCWLGGGCIINGPTKIGKGCTVAAGAVVRGDFPDYCVIGGVPARVLKMIDPPKGLHDISKYR
ncbi:maltose O-acetyltransferase, partial [Tremellales sp. Uapishka_1]